jgi:hypothetical protein
MLTVPAIRILRGPCAQKKKKKDKDKFTLWVLFATTMAVFLALTIQWLELALTSLITWMTDGPSTFVKCIQLNNGCSSAMLSQSVIKKKKTCKITV